MKTVDLEKLQSCDIQTGQNNAQFFIYFLIFFYGSEPFLSNRARQRDNLHDSKREKNMSVDMGSVLQRSKCRLCGYAAN